MRNGYIACLFNELGYRTFAMDSGDDPKRDEMFARRNIGFTSGNLNDAPPLTAYADTSMDVVVLGEVFEHVLNHPAGLLQAVHRILRPGGVTLLTTPNPSTLANSVRLLGDGYVLWGTPAFLAMSSFGTGTSSIAVTSTTASIQPGSSWS